jgi:hypothetical protein
MDTFHIANVNTYEGVVKIVTQTYFISISARFETLTFVFVVAASKLGVLGSI